MKPVEVPTYQRTSRESRNPNSDKPVAPGSSTRAMLEARFTELKALIAPLKSQVAEERGIDKTPQGQVPLGSYPAAARIALPSYPAEAQGVLALQQHGGVGPRSRSMQILGFCKPTVSRVETLEKAPNSDSESQGTDKFTYLRCHFPELEWQLTLLRSHFPEQGGTTSPELSRSSEIHRHNAEVEETILEKAPNSDSESQRTDKFTHLRCHFPELKWQLTLLRSHFPEQGGTTSPELSRSSEIHRHNAEVEETIPKLLGGTGPGSRFLQNIGYFKPTDSRDGKTAEDERPSSSDSTHIGPVGGPRTEENLSLNEAEVYETQFGHLLDAAGELQSTVKVMNNRLIHVEEVLNIREANPRAMHEETSLAEEMVGIHEVNPQGVHEERSSVMQPQLDRSVSFSDWLHETRVTGLNEATQERVLQRSFAFHRIDVRLKEQEAPEGSDPAPPRNDSSQQQPGPSGLLEAPEGSDPSPSDLSRENY